jgi:hypothetical protein
MLARTGLVLLPPNPVPPPPHRHTHTSRGIRPPGGARCPLAPTCSAARRGPSRAGRGWSPPLLSPAPRRRHASWAAAVQSSLLPSSLAIVCWCPGCLPLPGFPVLPPESETPHPRGSRWQARGLPPESRGLVVPPPGAGSFQGSRHCAPPPLTPTPPHPPPRRALLPFRVIPPFSPRLTLSPPRRSLASRY